MAGGTKESIVFSEDGIGKAKVDLIIAPDFMHMKVFLDEQKSRADVNFQLCGQPELWLDLGEVDDHVEFLQ